MVEDLVAKLLRPDIDAQVGSNGLVTKVLLDGSIVGLVPDPAQLMEAVEGPLEMEELALELGDLLDDGLGEGYKDVVDVKISMEVHLVAFVCSMKSPCLAAMAKKVQSNGAWRVGVKVQWKPMPAVKCLVAHCNDVLMV